MLRQTEIEGIPALIAPTSGPMTAGLVFRVGRSDETLATAGITHLVEHLALHRHGVADYHYNGASSSVYTTFLAQGTESDIVGYLNGVCESLASMPLHRLETEKQILRTEAAGRGRGVNHQLPLWRYGAQGHGLVSYPEYGLSGLTPDHVEHWVRTWFTRENAVLWIAGGDVPTGLRLGLHAGRRMPMAATTSILPATPAYFVGDPGAIVVDMVVRRSAAAQVAATVLERELFRSLRQDGGYSYSVASSIDSRGDGTATITAFVDALPEKQDAALGAFIDVLAALDAGRIDGDDIRFARARAEEAFAHPDFHAARLASVAAGMLTGQPVHTVDELRQELVAVTEADVRHALNEGLSTALLQVPKGHSADWAGFTAAAEYSDSVVAGKTHRSLEHNTVELIVGAEGVSTKTPLGPVTVRFAQCAAMLAWADGARRLVGHDGIIVHIEPTMYEDGRAAISAIDAGMAPRSVVWLPARDPGQIPRPDYMLVRQGFATRRWKIEVVLVGLFALFLAYLFAKTTGGMMMLSLLLIAVCLLRMIWLWAKVRNRTRTLINQ